MKAPAAAELKEALQSAWIRVQPYCSRERFRWGILRWHGKALIRAEWADLERIWRRYSEKDPQKAEYRTTADGWASRLAWLESAELPQEVLDYDPTEKLHCIEYDWCPRSEPDALDRIALANMFEVEDRIGKDALRAAGWIVDDVVSPAWPSE